MSIKNLQTHIALFFLVLPVQFSASDNSTYKGQPQFVPKTLSPVYSFLFHNFPSIGLATKWLRILSLDGIDKSAVI